MTDEELAEQFADNISGLELACSLLSAKDKSHAYRLGRYEGFLAGIKAKTQWHTDPNDLPDDDREVICKIMTSQLDVYGTIIDSFIRVGSRRVWKATPNVPKIAWCEIPEFKEAE